MQLKEDNVLGAGGRRDDMMDDVEKALRSSGIKRAMGESRGRS